MVTKNVGLFDSGIRAILGVLLLVASAALGARPLLALVAGLVALVLIGTALFRVCPLYTSLGLNTCGTDTQPHRR